MARSASRRTYSLDEMPKRLSFSLSLERVLAVEMEAAALYLNASRHNKHAISICTISDNPFTGEGLSSEERQNSFTQMMEIALEIA